MSAGQDDSGEDGCRTVQIRRGRMQDRTDAGQDRCRTGQMHYRMDGRQEQRQEVCRIRGLQDKRDEGQRYAG